MYDFLTDLDGYFCEKYAHYEKLCILPGYEMPTMHRTERREDGRLYSYTLPANTMRLAAQEKSGELLAKLKEGMTDATFSFSFCPVGFFRRFLDVFSKNAPKKVWRTLFTKYGCSPESLLEELSIEKEVWENICKGKFDPTKNLLLSVAFAMQLSYDDAERLLFYYGYAFNDKLVKDVVTSYLLTRKIYNRGMIDAALEEYKVANLFLK